jgi:hypothetical protein
MRERPVWADLEREGIEIVVFVFLCLLSGHDGLGGRRERDGFIGSLQHGDMGSGREEGGEVSDEDSLYSI